MATLTGLIEYNHIKFTCIDSKCDIFVNVDKQIGISDKDIEDRFTEKFIDILTNGLFDTNTTKSDKSDYLSKWSCHDMIGEVYHMTNKDSNHMLTVIFNCIKVMTNMFKIWIHHLVKTDQFSIDLLTNTLIELYKRIVLLDNLTVYFERCIDHNILLLENKYNQNTILYCIYQYLVYKDVCLNSDYEWKQGIKINLLQLIDKYLEDQCMKIDLDRLLEMGIFNQLWSNLKLLYNDSNSKINFYDNAGSNLEFVKMLVETIDNTIVNSNIKDDVETDYICISGLKKLIRMANNFDEQIMFKTYYENCLEERILGNFHECNITLERNLINCFKDSKFVQKMMFRLDDIINSRQHKLFYDNLEIEQSSDKYKDMKLDIDRSKVTVFALRYAVWSESMSNEYINYILPHELEPYVDTYSAYYSLRYPQQHLRFNFNNGVAVVSLKFDKEYHFKLTTAQMILLYKFNKPGIKLSATEIADSIGISLITLTPIINSFLLIKLLAREDGDATDPHLKFYINKEFMNDNSNLSLINVFKHMLNSSGSKSVDDKVIEKVAFSRQKLVKCLVVNILKKEQILSFDGLMDELINKTKFTITKLVLTNSLTQSIKEGYVKTMAFESDTVLYSYVDGDDSDTDESAIKVSEIQPCTDVVVEVD